MSSPYQYDPTPERLEIRCPKCGAPARFGFGRRRYVDSRALRAELALHPAYELDIRVEWANNHRTIATYYPDLDPLQTGPLVMPERGTWRHSRRGSVHCGACGFRTRHRLCWPDDAVYTCEVRGKTLWAWTRDHAVTLRNFIASPHRDRRQFRHSLFLMHVPSHFLKAKHRAEALKKLERLLAV